MQQTGTSRFTLAGEMNFSRDFARCHIKAITVLTVVWKCLLRTDVINVSCVRVKIMPLCVGKPCIMYELLHLAQSLEVCSCVFGIKCRLVAPPTGPLSILNSLGGLYLGVDQGTPFPFPHLDQFCLSLVPRLREKGKKRMGGRGGCAGALWR